MVKSNYIPGTALICVYGVEESAVLNQDLHNVFISKIYLWDVDQRASRILKQIFEYVNRKFLVKKVIFYRQGWMLWRRWRCGFCPCS